MSEEKKVGMTFIEDIDHETNEKVSMEKEIKSLKEEIEKLKCELDKCKDKLYCLAPPLPTDLWERSKNVWGSALHAYLSGEFMDPGPLAIIERALFDAERRGPSGRIDPDKKNCNGNCSCSSNKVSGDETTEKRTSRKKAKTTTRKKK